MDEYNNYDAVEKLFIGKKRFVNLTIVGLNVLVFILINVLSGNELKEACFDAFSQHSPSVMAGQYYRLFTCMFLHVNAAHIFGNMIMILFVGDELENITGHLKYSIIAIIGGLSGNVATLFFDNMRKMYPFSMGASGLAYGILGGMIACMIKKRDNRNISLKKIIVVTILMLITDFTTTNVNAIAHLGGLIAGLILGIIMV